MANSGVKLPTCSQSLIERTWQANFYLAQVNHGFSCPIGISPDGTLSLNFAGTLFAALFCTFTPVLTPELKDGMLDISRQIMTPGWFEMFFKGISSGFLMAAMVWLLPSAEAAQFHVTVLMTWLISAGGFMHIVAGSIAASWWCSTATCNGCR